MQCLFVLSWDPMANYQVNFYPLLKFVSLHKNFFQLLQTFLRKKFFFGFIVFHWADVLYGQL